jgi:hypothetical protein
MGEILQSRSEFAMNIAKFGYMKKIGTHGIVGV